jgi:hypothetical protein
MPVDPTVRVVRTVRPGSSAGVPSEPRLFRTSVELGCSGQYVDLFGHPTANPHLCEESGSLEGLVVFTKGSRALALIRAGSQWPSAPPPASGVRLVSGASTRPCSGWPGWGSAGRGAAVNELITHYYRCVNKGIRGVLQDSNSTRNFEFQANSGECLEQVKSNPEGVVAFLEYRLSNRLLKLSPSSATTESAVTLRSRRFCSAWMQIHWKITLASTCIRLFESLGYLL